MKIIKKVPVIEVKRAFVIADFAKVKGNQRGLSEKLFIKSFENAKRKVLKLKESALDSYIEWPKRLKAYNNSTWYIAEVSPSELGAWRRTSGLPLSWTNKTLKQTAEKIKYAIDYKSGLLKKRSRYAIGNMLKSPFQLSQRDKYSLPIAFKTDTGTRGRIYLKTKTKADIDDGCMRCIAMTISGKKLIKTYYGVPKK